MPPKNAFQKAGLHVYVTARDLFKMTQVASLGIETLTLDVHFEPSIGVCANESSNLDILINNAGAGYNIPRSDLSIPEAKDLFKLNVWSYLAVTQAILPLLLKSKGMIINQTSIADSLTLSF